MGKHIRNGIDYTDPNVDRTLNNTSENPVQNKVITEALANKVNISDIDSALSETSENPVQNKVVTAKIEEIKAIQNNINGLTFISYKMEKGGFNNYGQKSENDTRARTAYFCSFAVLNSVIHFPQGTKHRFIYYEMGQESTYQSMSEWSTAVEDNIVSITTTNLCFKILVGYTDDRLITDDNIPVPYFNFIKPKDNKVLGIENRSVRSYMPSCAYNTDFMLSPIIPVESGKSYRATKFRNTIFYDKDIQPLRVLETVDITDNTITVGSNDAFVSFCWRKTDTSEMYFAEVDKYIAGATIENLVPVDLMGKKLSLLGDSISAYTGTIPTGNDVYYTGNNSGVSDSSQMWWSVLCRKTGMIPLVINGYSGSGITQLTDANHASKVPMSDVTRDQALNDGTTTPDIILIAGGVNDFTYAEQASQVPGNWDGTTAPTKGNSFDETYACMIKEIQTAYPNAIIVCLSTWFTMRGTDNGYTLINGEGLTQSDYDNAIEKVAKIMRVPFLRVDNCGFSRSNFYPTFATDSSTIPTHPNAAGHKVMGEYIAYNLPRIVKAFTQ